MILEISVRVTKRYVMICHCHGLVIRREFLPEIHDKPNMWHTHLRPSEADENGTQ